MELDFSPEQKKFRDDLRDYFNKMMTPELVEELRGDGEGGGPLFRKAMKDMGRDGLLGVGWPTEYGGQGRTPWSNSFLPTKCSRLDFRFPS